MRPFQASKSYEQQRWEADDQSHRSPLRLHRPCTFRSSLRALHAIAIPPRLSGPQCSKPCTLAGCLVCFCIRPRRSTASCCGTNTLSSQHRRRAGSEWAICCYELSISWLYMVPTALLFLPPSLLQEPVLQHPHLGISGSRPRVDGVAPVPHQGARPRPAGQPQGHGHCSLRARDGEHCRGQSRADVATVGHKKKLHSTGKKRKFSSL